MLDSDRNVELELFLLLELEIDWLDELSCVLDEEVDRLDCDEPRDELDDWLDWLLEPDELEAVLVDSSIVDCDEDDRLDVLEVAVDAVDDDSVRDETDDELDSEDSIRSMSPCCHLCPAFNAYPRCPIRPVRKDFEVHFPIIHASMSWRRESVSFCEMAQKPPNVTSPLDIDWKLHSFASEPS